MDNFFKQIQIQVNDKIYLKDPHSSELGKKLIQQSILLIDEIGLEGFTFRKLAMQLQTTESSIYRYFESKHKLLVYLTSWYWGWLECRLIFSLNNISSAEQKLKLAIAIVAEDITDEVKHDLFDLDVLSRIVVSESSKAYLFKGVDEANKEGAYASYKRLVERISSIVLEINAAFKYSHTLISTIVEGVHHQKYFAQHLPSLTDIKKNAKELEQFYYQMAIGIIKSKGK